MRKGKYEPVLSFMQRRRAACIMTLVVMKSFTVEALIHSMTLLNSSTIRLYASTDKQAEGIYKKRRNSEGSATGVKEEETLSSAVLSVKASCLLP